MEIDRTSAARPRHLNPVTPSAAGTGAPAGSERDAEVRLDRIELSSAARDIQDEPDAAREAKLAALRAQIDAGTYRMDPDGVARRIVAREDI